VQSSPQISIDVLDNFGEISIRRTCERIPLHYSPAEIKKRIQQQFGKVADAYFRVFQQYVGGKLTKQEYDKELKILLSEGQSRAQLNSHDIPPGKLHNLFILTILRSAYSMVAATNIQPRRPLKSSTNARITANGTENAVVTPEESLVSDLRCCARSLDHKPSHYMPRTLDHVGTRDLTKQPLYETLRSQMLYKASLSGVEVDNSSISLMLLALEHHIKSIVSNCRSQRLRKKFPKPRLATGNRQFLPMLEYNNKELMDTNRPGTIDQMDVQLTLETSPQVLPGQGYHMIEYSNLNRKED